MSINTYNCKNAKVFVIARSLSNASRVFTEEAPVNEYYGSGCCSFTSTSFDAINYNQTGVENFEIMIKVIGGNVSSGEVSIGIDNIMLENNIGNSGYSMVEFGNFENYAINSSGSTTQTYANFWSGIGTGVSVISQGNPFGKVLTIAGNISTEKYVKQTVYRASSTDIAYYDYGEPYDDRAKTFLVSGFAKGTRQVANENSKFRIRVDIKYYKGSGVADEVDSRYLDFQTDCEDWQFISKSITTTDYELIHEIDIICEYTYQPGTAYFDNIAFTLSTDESVVTNEYYVLVFLLLSVIVYEDVLIVNVSNKPSSSV